MSKSRKTKLRRERTMFEWTLLAVSVAAISVIVTGLVTFSLSLDVGPPDLSVTVRPTQGAEFVLTIANEGGTTAEDVIVVVRRGTSEQEVEFRSVPKGDEEEATVTLTGTGVPRAEVASYQEP